MSGARNDGPSVRTTGDDPFAEFIDLIEDREPGSRSGHVRPASQGWDQFHHTGEEASTHRAGGPSDAEFDLDRALAEELAIGPQDAGYAPHVHRAPREFYDNNEQSDVGLALAGLSEPATPRIAGPAETGALAPERHYAEPEITDNALTLDDFDELIASELAVLRQPSPASYAGEPVYDPAPEFAADAYAGYDGHDTAYETVAAAPVAARRARITSGGNQRRALFFAGGVAAVALVGVFGIYAGGGVIAEAVGSGEPVLIRADSEPFKIAPADPGGAVVPNQNQAVYQRVVRGASMPVPEQEMLITAAEEPLDISFEDEVSDLPGVMVGAPDLPATEEIQVAQAPTGATDVSPVLQPHRVRTFDVRPDGTLVPRADTAAEAAAAPATQSPTPLDPVTATGRPAMPFSVDLPNAPATAAPAAGETATPLAPPAAEAVAATQPAAAPAALPADAHFVQISSQPSEALAQSSMASLSERYASAIGGRGLTIQPAEIDGRGTFYRVRVITASRDEANSVCENLQSAGGSCFVTR